ncbi:hypothetical protein LTR29_002488 [Friedmanniomyces endolithicus]|nr:hypothetical protein LTR29_002488 [Friedmanniomyces endolithicus]
MHAAKIYPALLALFTMLRPVTAQNTTTVTPVLTPVFTAQVFLGALVGPISIYGGAQIVEPITHGSINGTAVNGTISAGGAAAIGVYANQTVHKTFVEVWGKTDDGMPFFVQVNGIGGVTGQFGSASVTIGGRYAYLENQFILVSLTDNEANPPTAATIQGWLVSRTA